MARLRWILRIQANIWRVLMGLGMLFHRLAPPRPRQPAFSKTIQSTISKKRGPIQLYFYVPPQYERQEGILNDIRTHEQNIDTADLGKAKHQRTSAVGRVARTARPYNQRTRAHRPYPAVINFHGGGFTLGAPTDDARWCTTVADECKALVVSVGYRPAPEYPFPNAVEDGVDAIIWIYKHAAELGIDRDKIAISGFSSGGNMAFTVSLRLHEYTMGNSPPFRSNADSEFQGSVSTSFWAKANPNRNVDFVDPLDPQGHVSSSPNAEAIINSHKATPTGPCPIALRAVLAWYPSTDYTRTREQRRATCLRKDQELPSLFTNLFDESYLYPPDSVALDSPYLSPGVAPTALLKNGLPDDIIMLCCEWDMLLAEGLDFRDRLLSPEIDKRVSYTLIEGVPHGWDKAPNPLNAARDVRDYYLRACGELERVFRNG
ncbi:hypothetical protein WHR41_09163 [Cladosporium halotolerans]|uniref:Alpha/beta hydrolase fold-3 domain-containing protein n=1 Tax=Cladosporium halotolerans TaxID=1052096 RepID=A0AB34KBG6_9PEZI